MGIVEMSCAEDVEEILATKDQIAIGGQRPYIWKPADKHTLATLMMGKDNGIHLEQYKGRWYVFEVGQGQLRWCRVLTQHEAATFLQAVFRYLYGLVAARNFPQTDTRRRILLGFPPR